MEIMVKIWGPEISAYLNSGFSGKAMVSNQMAAKKVISARFSSCICSVSCRVLRPRHAKLRSGKMTPGCCWFGVKNIVSTSFQWSLTMSIAHPVHQLWWHPAPLRCRPGRTTPQCLCCNTSPVVNGSKWLASPTADSKVWRAGDTAQEK